MKVNRALAAAAALTAVGSASLLASPAAYATGDAPADSGAPSASATAEPSAEPSAGSGDADEAGTPARATGDAAGEREQAGQGGKSGPKDATAPSADKAGPTPSPSYTRPTFCSGIPDEERGKTELRDLPSRIVAGSGWHAFTYRVTNVSEVKVMETDLTVYLGTADPELDDVADLGVTLEWFDPGTEAWQPVEGEGAEWDDNQDFATLGVLAPGEHQDARMRIRIAADATAGSGYFFTTGHSYGEDGQCGFDEISRFDFTVLAAGSEPGKVEDAKGRPGDKADRAELTKEREKSGKGDHRPQGGRAEPAADGGLAETGSSSALPTMAVAGGAAIAAGAAAVFVVRRRKAASGE
ncbi:LPXTG cell wall anchor domain-containing protein [Streptomyces luteocolor]|uniref:LPXTG cell wall anchor domain-containing protein n=1 Tax=Streptomyces luteocolor TaxID=285500 RepID=UPI000852C059|nr:LPXTG cell wall anchor domain-containing protein [Streptomyces luteocolor]